MTAIALTIAGSDSGGGAGIQADLKAFSALGVYGASVITALTAQNTLGVTAIHDPPVEFLEKQIDAVYSDLAVGATKIGMLSRPEVIETVRAGLDRHAAKNVVLDPVMVAASGDPLLAAEAVQTLKERLVPRADLVTPNLHEAARLTGLPFARTQAEMRAQGEAILAMGAKAVLVKGGHFAGEDAADVLVRPGFVKWYLAPRFETKNTHGTGCTLSSAIAASLAAGTDLVDAVAVAKTYLTDAIAAADRLSIGHGHGPVHHFHRWWTP